MNLVKMHDIVALMRMKYKIVYALRNFSSLYIVANFYGYGKM